MADSVDASMESAEQKTAEVQPVDVATFVNDAVFNEVEKLSRDPLNGVAAPTEMKEVVDEEVVEAEMMADFPTLVGAIRLYSVSYRIACTVAKTVVANTKAQFGRKQKDVKMSVELTDQMRDAFTKTKYIGDAPFKFANYLWRCWKAYNPEKYKAPYVAVVQSSGFGKSRMVFELACQARHGDTDEVDECWKHMRVLYTCVRSHESSGFPQKTESLRGWLFPNSDANVVEMAHCLKQIYYHAEANWANVQTEWISLFTHGGADAAIKKVLEKTEIKKSSDAKQKNPENSKMVVLVVDEARWLLAEGKNTLNHFRMLRQALALANKQIGAEGGIFGVLIDTNSKISDLTPPLATDPSSRNDKGEELASFPPFVLTHTMDAYWREYCSGTSKDASTEGKDQNVMKAEIAMYKAVAVGDEDNAWKALQRMGRPMWFTFPGRRDVVGLAANKLLLGLPPNASAFTEKTMFGVASMLCRIGVRPHSTSPLASRAVADFMAILAYVNYVREGYLSSYASDPILALGAMKVWYTESSALPMYILPQLKKLILDEALDTGGIGEMVARILLLLAMDKCVMEGKSVVDCTLTGRFVSVGAFLRELEGGENLAIFERGMKSAVDTTAFEKWRSQWKDWQMRFTHFVQLQVQPNEDTLWYLLGRRAAGIFPRNQGGADLLIPIFWRKPISSKSTMETVDGANEAKMEMEDEMSSPMPEECPQVSFILIQVKSRSPTDSGFTQSATRKLTPWFTFKPQANALSKKAVHEVIRVYMNLRETTISTRGRDCYKFIYATSLKDNSPKPKAGKQKKNGEPKGATQVEGTTAKEDTNSTDVEPKQKKQKRGQTTGGKDASTKGSDGSDVVHSAAGGDDVQMEDAQASGEANVNIQKRKRPVVAEAQGTTAPIESKVENTMFTYCFRSLCCKSYPFLEASVATSLKTMVESLWYPMGLVDGDLEQRRRIEEASSGNEGKAKLSDVMPDDELKDMASEAFAYAPGDRGD